ARAAIADIFEVDRRRQIQMGNGGRGGDEVARLRRPRRAEREVVIGTNRETGAVRFLEVAGKTGVLPVTAFARFEINEADILAGDALPVDGALVVRDVNAAHRK